MESRCSCRLFASSLEIGLVPGGAQTPRGTVWSIDSGPGSFNAGQQRGLPRPGQLSETRGVDPATGIGNGFWALAVPHCQGGMPSAETMPSWPRLWGFVGRRQIANWKPCRAADLDVNSHNRRMAWELARCPAGMPSAAAAFVCFLDPAEGDLVRW